MTDTMYLIDSFVSTTPGEPYRLLPFGKVVKGGRERNITPELARSFRLPHFKPPVKMGSHDDTTPAGGHIMALEVRDDGLYAIPEFTEKGALALADGSYRYHSPEVLWEGGFEDPQTGAMIKAPLIVGDALLHMPHLGEAAALYSVEPFVKELDNMSDSVQIPMGLWEKFLAKLFPAEPAPTPEPAPVEPPASPEVPDEYKAAVVQRDEYKAKLDQLEAERVKAEKWTALKAEFTSDEFGATYIELGKAEETVRMMEGMTDEQREWCMRNFKAMSKQIETNDAITKETGSSAVNDLPARDQQHAAITAYMAEKKVDYPTAFDALRVAQPDLFKA